MRLSFHSLATNTLSAYWWSLSLFCGHHYNHSAGRNCHRHRYCNVPRWYQLQQGRAALERSTKGFTGTDSSYSAGNFIQANLPFELHLGDIEEIKRQLPNKQHGFPMIPAEDQLATPQNAKIKRFKIFSVECRYWSTSSVSIRLLVFL